MNINFEPIHFSELKSKTDGDTVVFTAVQFPENQDWKDVEDFVNEMTGGGSKLKAVRRILDNLLGDDGRWDYLIEIEGNPVTPMGRLMHGDWVKWTSDFVDNYRTDFK